LNGTDRVAHPIDVIVTIRESLRLTHDRFAVYARVLVSWGALGIGLTMVLELARLGDVGRSEALAPDTLHPVIDLAHLVLGVVWPVPIQVQLCRAALLERAAAESDRPFRFGRRDRRYLWVFLKVAILVLALGVLAVVVAMLVTALVGIATHGDIDSFLDSWRGGLVMLIVFALVILFVAPRFICAFIDAAIDRKPSLRRAWRQSRGNTIRLFLLFALAYVVPLIPVWVLSAFSCEGGEPTVACAVVGVIAIALEIGPIVVSAVAMAVAYRSLGDWEPKLEAGVATETG
jgi:uncharacterized membrane protein